MPSRFQNWLVAPVRTPVRAALSAAALALILLAVWHALGLRQFHRDQVAAQEALASYDFPEARRRLLLCLAFRPNDQGVRLLAAQAARRDGLLDEAQVHLDQCGEMTKGLTPKGDLQTTLLRVQQGGVNEHVHALIEDLEVRHPGSEQMLEALALGCVHVYRLDEASFWTKQLLQRFPHNPIGRLLDAQTNETLRHRGRAIEIAQRLVEDYPANDKARLYLAGLLSANRQYEDAARHFRELHRRQPAEIRPLLGLIRALAPLDHVDEAGRLLEKLEKEHPENTEILLEYGRFVLRQKRPHDAERLLRRALLQSPGDHDVHFELSVCLWQLDRLDESRQHLERHKQIEADMKSLESAFQAMVKAPADPEPRLEAARICLRNGQKAEGLRWLGGALEIAPRHPAVHAALADYYQAEGDSARAEDHRRRAR